LIQPFLRHQMNSDFPDMFYYEYFAFD
jgi:hypothetical protein